MSSKVKSFLKKRTRTTDAGDSSTVEPVVTKADRSKSLGYVIREDDSSHKEEWNDLALIKTISPLVMCVLPSTAKDFVASTLLAIGAYPIMPEDVDDVECQLAAAHAVLVDTSAKRDMVEGVIEHHIVGSAPVILVCWESGTNDYRKNLTRRVAEVCKPAVISGRLGDVHALSLDIMDRAKGIIGAEDDKKEVQRSKSNSPDESSYKATLGATNSIDRAHSPRFMRKKEAGKIYQRQQSGIPQMVLKGQFRHQSIKDVKIPEAFKSAQKLGAQLGCYIHLYETNVVTCGEFFYQVNNTQIGMERLHHTVQCAAAIMSATIACVEQQEEEEVTLLTCGHALSLYHVAAEDAVAIASSGNEMAHPGSLKVAFIDMLHKLDEMTVQLKAQTQFHNAPPKH